MRMRLPLFHMLLRSGTETTIYACPNCGHRFRKNGEASALYLKCPRCKKRDMCSRSWNQSIYD